MLASAACVLVLSLSLSLKHSSPSSKLMVGAAQHNSFNVRSELWWRTQSKAFRVWWSEKHLHLCFFDVSVYVAEGAVVTLTLIIYDLRVHICHWHHLSIWQQTS